MSNNQLTYQIDMVLCIDCTGSMRGTLQAVKDAALDFQSMFQTRMRDKGKIITGMRVRVVAFRDIFADDPAFEVSDFFNLEFESEQFKDFLSELKAKGGGGDGPESALEAVSIALNSDWSTEADKLRHVVVMWTDALPHPLERGAEQHTQSPFRSSIAESLNQLTDWWNDRQNDRIRHEAKRFVIFAPEKGVWIDIAENWDQTVFLPSAAGKGLREFELDQILEILVNSI
jgi:hypothetical protein